MAAAAVEPETIEIGEAKVGEAKVGEAKVDAYLGRPYAGSLDPEYADQAMELLFCEPNLSMYPVVDGVIGFPQSRTGSCFGFLFKYEKGPITIVVILKTETRSVLDEILRGLGEDAASVTRFQRMPVMTVFAQLPSNTYFLYCDNLTQWVDPVGEFLKAFNLLRGCHVMYNGQLCIRRGDSMVLRQPLDKLVAAGEHIIRLSALLTGMERLPVVEDFGTLQQQRNPREGVAKQQLLVLLDDNFESARGCGLVGATDLGFRCRSIACGFSCENEEDMRCVETWSYLLAPRAVRWMSLDEESMASLRSQNTVFLPPCSIANLLSVRERKVLPYALMGMLDRQIAISTGTPSSASSGVEQLIADTYRDSWLTIDLVVNHPRDAIPSSWGSFEIRMQSSKQAVLDTVFRRCVRLKYILDETLKKLENGHYNRFSSMHTEVQGQMAVAQQAFRELNRLLDAFGRATMTSEMAFREKVTGIVEEVNRVIAAINTYRARHYQSLEPTFSATTDLHM